MTSHLPAVGVTNMNIKWGAAAVILMATLACDSTGPEPKPVQEVRITRGQIVFSDPDHSGIFLADSNGHRLQQLRAKGSMDAAVSPDGKQIAISGACNLWCSYITIITADGRDRILLQTGDTLNQPHHPTWSPDGKLIAFVQIGVGNDGTRSWHIYTINADGSGVTQLTHSGSHDSPEWSPDGSKILFTGAQIAIDSPGALLDGAGGNNGIFEMDRNGSNVRQLTSGDGGTRPTWSPDGSHIAFLRFDPDGFNESAGGNIGTLFVMNADGSNVTALTSGFPWDASPAWYANPAWSPDGRSIAFAVVTASKTCIPWNDESVTYPCGYSVKRVGLDGIIDPSWALSSASYVVWQR